MVKNIRGLGLAALLAAPWAGAAPTCEPLEGIVSICGLHNPEDLARLPDTPYILFSQMQEGAGIGWLDTRDDSVGILYRGGAGESEPGWGDAACTEPPTTQLNTHGLDLRRREDGRWQLLAVNHGGREAVEFLEVLPAADAPPALAWRGCAVAPEDATFNDVAALPDGEFLVSHTHSRSAPTWPLLKALLFGADSGFIYRWSSGKGFTAVPGTGAPYPNGVNVEPGGEHFYVNAYLAREVRKYALAGGAPLAVLPVGSPDNSNWDEQGRLLVAVHEYGWTNLLDGLPNDDGSPIDLRFTVLLLDPRDMTATTLLDLEGPPMGGGTAALVVDGQAYIGTYAGDRIIRVPLAQ